MTLLLGLSIGIAFFIVSFIGFREGLRLGMNTAKGIIPESIKSPVKAIHEHRENKEQAKANKLYNEGLNAILTYTGDLPKEQG